MVAALIGRLVDALKGRGLSAEPFAASMVWVTNRMPGGPELRQAVLCRADDQGRPGWWWAWTNRDDEPEYELIGPAEEITAAALAIGRVLAPRPVPGR